MLKPGYYCALGTPLDRDGKFLPRSFAAQINDQIENGASGLLCMGSMGMLGCVRSDEYANVVDGAVEANGDRITLLVGAFDNSIGRVKERIDQIKKYRDKIAMVLTGPYYFGYSKKDAFNYFMEAGEYWGGDMFIYDHYWTAHYKCNFPDMKELLVKIPRLKGIKTGDMVLIKALMDYEGTPADFTPILSNSDLFVVGRPYGIDHYLDGIFACFPKTTGKAEAAYKAGDFANGKKYIDAIMAARDEMIEMRVMPAFTAAMNLLGYEGIFHPDYEDPITAAEEKKVRDILVGIGEL